MTQVLLRMREVGIELMRVNEVAAVCLSLGLERDEEIEKIVKENESCSNKENLSGIIYYLDLLHYFPEKKEKAQDLIKTLMDNQSSDGGFGRFIGDRSRIPVAWRVLEALSLNNYSYDVKLEQAIKWMEKEWSKDSVKGGLSYKCAGILIANSYYPNFNKDFINRCIKWMLQDQNSDGGWGPKKDSPVGSRPSDTALALRALSNYKDEKTDAAIEQGIKWLEKNRLENGFWKEHPVEKPLMYISLFLNKYLYGKNEFH